MAITETQRRVLEYYLGPHTGDDLERRTATLTVTKRQLAFLIEAIDHFQRTRCPLATSERAPVGCELLSGYEDTRTGSFALGCFEPCTAWLDTLIESVVPHAFPRRGRPPVRLDGRCTAAADHGPAAAATTRD
jgi:hypothetical protein